MTDTTTQDPLVADNQPDILGIPFNRIIAFGGPYIAVASGAVADWLLVHVHLLSLFHTTSTTVAGAITQGTVFGLTAILTWLGHQKWLTGHHIELAAAETAAQKNLDGPPAPVPTGAYDPSVFESKPSPDIDRSAGS